jgi:hypothetical protein
MHLGEDVKRPAMPAISLSKSSVTKGDRIGLLLLFRPDVAYEQMQVEVFTAGVANPSNALGFGTVPQRPADDQLAVEIDTQHLQVGVYEIGLVRLHSPTVPNATPQIDFVSGRDFTRQIFEVREPADSPRAHAQLLAHVVQLEQEHARSLAAVVDVRVDQSSPGEEFAALVFVRDILVGVGMRFDHFEIVPTHSGLDTEDAVRFVNTFLQERTATGIGFEYDPTTRDNARRTNPVCVVHFPALLAKDVEAARDYSVEKTNTLLLALSLSRDAGGVVFEIVLISKKGGQAVKYGIASPYVGNLLTGGLSGENFESVRTYLDGITASDTNRFLVSLYREARRERSRDFQYVRLWQILETMAEGRNYDASAVLRDYAGNPMTDNGQARLLKGSVNTVFNLFREEQVGDTETVWKNVNIWFAFRNAVAHHGAVSRYESLSRESVKDWARIGYKELQGTPDHDGFLWTLKEDVKLLLMRQLVKSAVGHASSKATA